VDIIIQWVTQIILFIVIASIIDLLVPADSMKKYVKLVVGLILILILLEPIFHVFNTDIDKSIEMSINELNHELKSNEPIENQIEFQKKEIQSGQHAYILEQMAVQLKALAGDPLKEEYQVEITTIDFIFNDTENISFEELTEVIVYIDEAKNGEGAVNTVEDVVINSKRHQEEPGEEVSEIEILLMEVWELTDKKVSIYWEGGAS
jgi:stage III sporulation protein AF